MAKVKPSNYTEEQVELLRTMYTGLDNKAELQAIQEVTGKSVASLRAKLASMGLYKTAEAPRSQSSLHTKMDLVDEIAIRVDLLEQDKEGLYKATKSALEKILARLA